MTPPRSSTGTLVAALRVLARDIRSPDGVANAAIEDAADRLEELSLAVKLTIEENAHLADGDDCTLWRLTQVMKRTRGRGTSDG